MQIPQVAIIYDRLNKFGGAERVLLALKQAYPNAVFFTSVYKKNTTNWTHEWNIKTTFLQKIPFASNNHDKLSLLMPVAFESLDLHSYDIIISVTSEFAKNVITHPHQLHVCYCLTPTRYLWSHTHEYEGQFLKMFKRYFFSYLRTVDFISARRPDIFIAISQLVKNRIKRYYKLNSESVIYPPVHAHTQSLSKIRADKEPYYLVVSRLVPYKHIEIAIQACLTLKKKLIIVGTGSMKSKLEKMTEGNTLIEFAGFISEKKLAEYYTFASALLCPQEEDFGIVSLEAQMYGTPVISYQYSGVAETIVPNKTGLVFEQQTTESLVECMQHFQTVTWNDTYIQNHALQFSEKYFIDKFRTCVDQAYAKLKNTLQ